MPSGTEAAPVSEQKPRIYVFSNVVGGGEGLCLALAEDGHVLGSHWCSSEGWATHDLGVEPGSRPDRHKAYAQHYPDGYEMVFVRARAVPSHKGIAAAHALNQELAAAERAERVGGE